MTLLDEPTTATGHLSLSVKGKNARRRQRRDQFFRLVLAVMMLIAAIPIVLVVIQVVQRGIGVISWEFFTQPEPPARREGGGYAAGFVGTFIIVVWATLMAIPVGILAAVYLVEYGKGVVASVIRFFTDVMTGIPSIFVGLAVYAFIIAASDGRFTFGAFPAAVAIAIIMLPIVVRSSEEMLKTVPADLRAGSYALGARRWQTITKVVLPAAAPGLSTASMLAIARGTGETAPLILTALGNVAIVTALFNTPISALPLQIYNGARQPFQPGLERAWGGALCLLAIVLILTVAARWIGSKAKLGEKR